MRVSLLSFLLVSQQIFPLAFVQVYLQALTLQPFEWEDSPLTFQCQLPLQVKLGQVFVQSRFTVIH